MKNEHAVALGRLGGRKGGLARKAKLSAARRSQIARGAVKARWTRQRAVAKYGLGDLSRELQTMALERIGRCKEAKRLAARYHVDIGIAEHTLSALALSPLRRLTAGLMFCRRLGQ